MENTTITVNEMLIAALTTDSRKRKARYQAELEALGYTIIKDGSWFIRNTKTDRFVDLAYNDDNLRTTNGYIRFGTVWKCGNYKKGTHGHYVKKPLTCIDIEGLLTKRAAKPYENNWTNVDRMRDALCNKKRHTKNLENLMNDYKSEIDALTAEYQRKLNEAKRSYEWNLEYHTNGLDRANKDIKALLKRKTA